MVQLKPIKSYQLNYTDFFNFLKNYILLISIFPGEKIIKKEWFYIYYHF